MPILILVLMVLTVLTTYVPCLGRVAAQAKACRVASSDVNQPVLRGGWAGSGVDSQDFLPVLQSQRVLDSLSGL